MHVLLREPEGCPICGGVFLSLYPLRHCGDHAGDVPLYAPVKNKAVPSSTPPVLNVAKGEWNAD